jgi:hypothetical protein
MQPGQARIAARAALPSAQPLDRRPDWLPAGWLEGAAGPAQAVPDQPAPVARGGTGDPVMPPAPGAMRPVDHGLRAGDVDQPLVLAV